MDGNPIRVAFLEDDRAVAEATMEALASRGMTVIWRVATVDATVALAGRDRPDVIVADIDLVGELALALPDALPDGPPIIWWSGHDERYRGAAMQAGGAGYVSKRASLEDLVSHIHRAAAGESTWTQADLRASRDAPRSPTAREREVLAGIAAGRQNKEIATDLGITERTVESHLGRMYDRYGTSNRIELIDLARRSGWV